MISNRKRVRAVEFIMEFVGELFGAAFELLTESKRIPKPLRVAIALVFFVPLTGLCIFCIVAMKGAALKALFALLTLFFIFGGYKTVKKIIKK